MFSRIYSDTSLSLLIVLSGSAWGLYWLPLRTIEQAGMAGSWSIVLVNACPLIVLFPLLIFHLKGLKVHPVPMTCAGFMIGAAFTLYANGLVETTIIRATLLFYLSPIWSTILGGIWLSERLTKARIFSILVAVIGLFLLLTDLNNSESTKLNIGDLFGFLSGIFWAIGATIINRWPNAPTLPLTTIVYVATTILSVLFAIFLYQDPMPNMGIIEDSFLTAAIWSIIILLPGFWIIFRVSQLLFPGRVGILMMSEVVVAIVSASILVPEETMAFLQWVGAGAILFAGVIEVFFGYSKIGKNPKSLR
ncbi:MAG: DMT family transporter [Paracoccaceae bacterium]|nr:DMT family transporter [Paracoccaceae bacterium]